MEKNEKIVEIFTKFFEARDNIEDFVKEVSLDCEKKEDLPERYRASVILNFSLIEVLIRFLDVMSLGLDLPESFNPKEVIIDLLSTDSSQWDEYIKKSTDNYKSDNAFYFLSDEAKKEMEESMSLENDLEEGYKEENVKVD